jgi:uncharacterized protein
MTAARHPYRLGPAKRLVDAPPDEHLAALVRLALLTGVGERVHRPEFGAGLGEAGLFEPVDEGVLALVEVRARGALEQALGDRVEVVQVQARRAEDSTLLAEVAYRLRPAGPPRTVQVPLA